MLPIYYLFQLKDGTYLVGCDEWSDILPEVIGWVRVKPLYLQCRSELTGFTKRDIEGITFYDLKKRHYGNSIKYLTERELLQIVNMFSPTVRIDWVASLMLINKDSIVRCWPPLPWTSIKTHLGSRIASEADEVFDCLLSGLEALSDAGLWIIGSAAYAGMTTSPADVDVAILLSPGTVVQFRARISHLRFRRPSLQPHDQPFSFAYKLMLSSGPLDIFPCLPEVCAHPLIKSREWKNENDRVSRKLHVTGVDLGSYALPVLRVTGYPGYAVLCSNGFRGAMKPGDVLEAKVCRTTVVKDDCTLDVDLVCDPWIDIVDVERYFDYQRDSTWVDV